MVIGCYNNEIIVVLARRLSFYMSVIDIISNAIYIVVGNL